MKKSLIALALVGAFTAPAAFAEEAKGPHNFAANVAVVSDYAFRGVSQNDERMALQGGVDYTHSSGVYAGFWASNVSWLSDASADVSNSLETNIYAGYAGQAGPVGYNVGLLQYYYPGSYGAAYRAGAKKPHTLEAYAGLTWEFLSFKYSYALSDLFGLPDSDGSQYFDLGASFPLAAGFALDAHVGYNDIVKGDNYTDWKLGVTKEYAGFKFGLHYVDTDIKGSKLADDRVILSVSKSF